MRVLLDTCILAELHRPKADPAVRRAVETLPDDTIFLSVITLGEITKGIEILQESRRKQDLSAWLTGLDRYFADRILPVDRETSGIWGEITARAQKQGTQIPAADGLIAATALQNGLHVMTRNTRDFIATGVLLFDPWTM